MQSGFEQRVECPCIGALVALVAGTISWGARADDATLTARMAPGPPGERVVAIDWSAAHALVREFGADSAFAPSDAALARVLADDGALERTSLASALQRYAGELTDVVALQAGPEALPQARVEWADGVALIRPGTGPIELPDGTVLVIIDLSDLPSVGKVDEILARAVAPALAGSIARPSRLVRWHQGPTNEVFTPTSTYSTTLVYRSEPALVGSASRDVPIILSVGPRISPQSASFAIALRAAGRAWIAGDSVPVEIAESTWQGVGTEGLMVRTSRLATLAPEPPVSSSGLSVGQNEFYLQDIDVSPDVNWSIALHGSPGDDLDLYLARDSDGDGVVDEVVLFSASETADEKLEWDGVTLPSGSYQLLVHGDFIAGESAPFTLELSSSLVFSLPDEILADLPGPIQQVHDGVALLERLRDSAPPVLSGPSTRAWPVAVNPFGFVHPSAEGRGELRAGLLIAHGMLRLFYPYFPEVGDTIDERLLETLQAADGYSGVDRLAAWRILRRFGEALHDGHQLVDTGAPLFESALPVYLEYAGMRPLVRRSMVPEIQPGDTIVALEGRPIESVYAEELARTSAATLGFQLDIADTQIYRMNGPLSLTLEDTFGVRRDVTIALQPYERYLAVLRPAESDRPSGALSDLGAPDLYYFNLNAASTPSQEDALRAIEEANTLGARGMVLDMRGYPVFDQYDIVARLLQGPFASPQFGYTFYAGPDRRETRVSQYWIERSGPPAYDGPIVLLTGPHAVSAAENFMQMLVASGQLLAVVGRASAGTNGDTTGLALPGGFAFTYTGLDVRNPDGSRFHGIGIVPEHEVPIVAEDLRDGIDRALLESVRVLREAVGP